MYLYIYRSNKDFAFSISFFLFLSIDHIYCGTMDILKTFYRIWCGLRKWQCHSGWSSKWFCMHSSKIFNWGIVFLSFFSQEKKDAYSTWIKPCREKQKAKIKNVKELLILFYFIVSIIVKLAESLGNWYNIIAALM